MCNYSGLAPHGKPTMLDPIIKSSKPTTGFALQIRPLSCFGHPLMIHPPAARQQVEKAVLVLGMRTLASEGGQQLEEAVKRLGIGRVGAQRLVMQTAVATIGLLAGDIC